MGELEYGTNKPLQQISQEFLAERRDLSEKEKIWKILVTFEEITCAVKYVAAKINHIFYKHSKPVVLCGILKGVYVYMSDLTRYLTIPYSVYFVEASSYKDSVVQSETVELLSKLIPSKFVGHKVILLDELFDHGATMATLKQKLLDNQALNLEKDDIFTCTLFAKNTDSHYPHPDLVGLNYLPSVWLVGYGLDDRGEKRGWKHLYAVPKPPGITLTEDDKMFDASEEIANKKYLEIRKAIQNQLSRLQAELPTLH